MLKGYNNVPLDIEGGDGEKTLGEAEKTLFNGTNASSSFLGRHRFPYLTLGTNDSE